MFLFRLRVTAKLFDIYLNEHGAIANGTDPYSNLRRHSGHGLYDLGNNEEYFAEFFEAKE